MTANNATTRRSVVSYLLLVAMLFYTSGLTLGVHLTLEHSPKAVEAACVPNQPCDGSSESTPTQTPKHEHCQLCDMLTGISKPVAILVEAHPILFTDEVGTALAVYETFVTQFSSAEISARGPPAKA